MHIFFFLLQGDVWKVSVREREDVSPLSVKDFPRQQVETKPVSMGPTGRLHCVMDRGNGGTGGLG